jgi:hypothetical protein
MPVMSGMAHVEVAIVVAILNDWRRDLCPLQGQIFLRISSANTLAKTWPFLSPRMCWPCSSTSQVLRINGPQHARVHAHEGEGGPVSRNLYYSSVPLKSTTSPTSILPPAGLPYRTTGLSDALACGIESFEAPVREGISFGADRCLALLQATNDAQPFADARLAACDFKILPHVPDLTPVVGEMLRVARNVVVISDTNRSGRGPCPCESSSFCSSS